MNKPYPDGFFTMWSQEQRDAYFADATRGYRERQTSGAVNEELAETAPPPNGPEDYGNQAAAHEEPSATVLPTVTVSSLASRPIPLRCWHVPDMIPGRTVTLLGGDGGTGKSIVAKQLGVATAAGKPWLGTSPEQGPVIYLSAEDDLDELHRRLNDIAVSYGVALAELDNFHLIPRAGLDAVLAAPGAKPGIISPTSVWRGLLPVIETVKPRLAIFDNLADVYAANENARAEARQFVGMLRGLAIDHDMAVLLLAHPSLTGLNSGTGTSGSTAWSNSVRARLYLEPLKGDDGREIDADLRMLRVMKSNYGRAGLELRLRWSRGCFILDGAVGSFDKLAADAKAERVFLDLLATFESQGREVSPSPSAAYAPAVFEKHPNAEGFTKKAFSAAMERLLAAERISVETIGPPSRRYKRMSISSEKDKE
jgi:RecA-family ATPase